MEGTNGTGFVPARGPRPRGGPEQHARYGEAVRRSAALVLVLGLVAVGCGSNDSSGDGGAVTKGASVSTREVLDFTLPAVDGGQIRGRDYSGKALALWFWAPW